MKTKHVHDDPRIDCPACVEWVKSPVLPQAPSLRAAIRAIEEKAQFLRPAKPGKEFDEWMKKMDEIDKKYGFIK